MTADDALREIARIVQDDLSDRKVRDRIFRVLVQAGVIAVPK